MEKKNKNTKNKKRKYVNNISVGSTATTLFFTSSERIAEEIAQEFKKQPRPENKNKN